MLNTVSVKTLAEFLHRSGDLYPPLGGRVTGEQGIGAQQRVQRGRAAGYQCEVSLQRTFEHGDLALTVSGRLDGCDLERAPPLVEEIKATRADPLEAERLVGSAHWAQLKIYAALLALDHPAVADWHLRLLYCHPTRPEERPFDRIFGRAELIEFLTSTLDRYVDRLRRQMAYADARDRWLNDRTFPYGAFRPHQRALAGRVFRALENGEHLLLEAPTGSGKTMGVLYPALKALAAGHVRRLFYLTSRGTGSRAVLKACHDIGELPAQIRAVELIAKEKACVVPGMPCDATCPYQTGYYERIHAAVGDLLDRSVMDRDTIGDVAAQHTVCPFELSLDAALWADLVVGDYNYLLDPVVRLQRFADDAEMGLLVDESHQLADRVRAMLSLDLDRAAVRAALAETPPAILGRRLRALDRVLLALHRTYAADLEAQPDREGVIARPDDVFRAMERVVEVLGEDLPELDAYPATRQLVFTLTRWIRSRSWSSGPPVEAAFRFLLQLTPVGRKAKGVILRLACLDPGPYLADVLAGYGGHVRFSGTVSPLPLYQTLHGMADAPAERVASTFLARQVLTLVVTDLPVYYRQRARTLPQLADLAAGVCSARAGSYLLAVPSFEYLDLLAAELARRHPGLVQCVQHPGMDEQAREAFIQGFAADGKTRIGLIVLGGVFGESVDFSHAPLAGVICVGVGLPPVSRLRSELDGYFEQKLGAGGGNTVAYQQPAMTKVLQMAGRLLRGPDDRGILCLVDERFCQPGYQRFYPGYWQPQAVRAREVGAHLANFWRTTPELPRLQASSGSPAAGSVESLV